MRAIALEEFGSPDVLKQIDVSEPLPGPGQVTIDVAYAGVNFHDLMTRSTGHRVRTLPYVPGIEVSGSIRDVGDGVTDLARGQQVAAYVPNGGYAATVTAVAAGVVPLPTGVSLRMAASLTVALPTAYVLLYRVARLQEGDSVLVHSAAGAVGTVAAQLARLGGASAVYGVASSPAKADFALEHGYDQVFSASTFDLDVMRATDGLGVDIALDPLGGESLSRTLAVVRRFGRLVSFGNASGSPHVWQIGPEETYTRGVSVGGFSLPRLAASDPSLFRGICELALRTTVDQRVTLPVTSEFDLADAAEAHRLIESRTSTGKLLLRVAA